MNKLVILHAAAPGAWESSLLALTHFLGVEASYVCVTADGLLSGLAGVKAVAMSADTLGALEGRAELWAAFGEMAGVFVYGYRSEKSHAALLNRLPGLVGAAIEPLRHATTCSFPRASRPFARQLAGCDFEREPRPADCAFRLGNGAGLETLMTLGGEPALVRATQRGATWFHWTAVDEIASPGTRLGEAALTRWCDRLVPPMLFLRAVFPGASWENPVKTARVVIDDPLLEPSYGFLKYQDLFDSMARLRYGTTTAFIPWNFQRTSQKAARWFAENHPAHSICVHGCDHTNNEFGVTDENLLGQKTQAALARMAEHEQRTGLPWDRVMVFPQGKFSTVAMRALRRAGVLAVVNSNRNATDRAGEDTLLGDELWPATNRYSGVPIFARRCPSRLSTFALDLFLGKPAHVMAHHDWFAQGCAELERCVRFLQEAEPGLSWPSLAESLPRQHLRREGGDGKCHVRFFTAKFAFENPDARARSFLFTRPEPDEGRVGSVTVEGRDVSFVPRDGFIEFECELGPREKISIQLNDAAPAVRAAWTPGLKYRAAVHARRLLSEFRDNHLVRYPALLRRANQGVRHLKWSADAEREGGAQPNPSA